MNIGRGDTVVEEDLIKALKDKIIAGAALDVFRQEPCPADNPLWSLPNVLMYPHCADDDPDQVKNTMFLIPKNVQNLINGQPLVNLVDKKLGY